MGVAICIAVFVVAFTIGGLMYQIHLWTEERKREERWYIEFHRKFEENSKEIECYKIFRETGRQADRHIDRHRGRRTNMID